MSIAAWSSNAGKCNADNPRVLPPQSHPHGKTYSIAACPDGSFSVDVTYHLTVTP